MRACADHPFAAFSLVATRGSKDHNAKNTDRSPPHCFLFVNSGKDALEFTPDGRLKC